jgi:cyanophycin synthetase
MLARLIAHMLQLSGRMPGVACSDGLYFDKRRVRIGDCTAFDAAQQVLINRLVEAAVIESSARSMATQGLPYDRCSVGIVTSLDGDFRMNDLWIDSPELVYRVLRTQIDVVLKTGFAVLNADDAQVLEMAELSDGEVVLYSTRVDHPAILAHVADGKRAVVACGAEVRLMQGSAVTSLAPGSAKGQTVRLIEAQLLGVWLPAVAAAWALGVPDHVIRTGLSTFAADNVSVQGVAAIA